jgi:tetratricopeptide (TPR) repeat protein
MPWNTDFSAEFTNALVRAGRYDQAKGLIKEALKHQPKSEQLHFNLGNCLARENRIGDAIKELEIARSLDPKSQAVLILIDIYSKTAPNKAKALLEDAKKWANPRTL